MSLFIHKTGVQALIQDRGRVGYRHLGIPASGPMDSYSFELAQLLCGNSGQEALIEFTLHGAIIEFEKATVIALTGGGATATINNKSILYNIAHVVKAGDTLKLSPSEFGCRTYLAIQGGLKVNAELGSCATYVPAQIGGIEGRALKAGDRIEFADEINNHRTAENILIQIKNPALELNEIPIRIHKGPEWGWFDNAAQSQLIKEKWRIGPQSNRMGYQLQGSPLLLKEKTELISTAVMPGIIQVTPSGMPIILGADAQTIGGYPRIARVHTPDLSIIGQCRPGVFLQFQLFDQ